MKKRLITASIVSILLVPFLFGGCSHKQDIPIGTGFEIYLTKEDVHVSEDIKLSQLQVADKPVISEEDIISYDIDTHEIELTLEAYKRLTQLPVDVAGTAFLACVDRQAVYWGAFWTYLSSVSFSGVTIIRPLRIPLEGERCLIIISLGYPDNTFYQGEDPRSNLDLMKSLEKAGKLSRPLVLYSYTEQPETTSKEGFAIYLTRDDIPTAKMPLFSHVDIADEPIISLNDIVSYDRDTHEIELTPDAYNRVLQLEVSTSGKSFVVCVDKQAVYWGAFWVGYSSQSFDGITIMTLPPFPGENTITISQGYPTSSFSHGEDPRLNPDIKESLEKAGKLK